MQYGVLCGWELADLTVQEADIEWLGREGQVKAPRGDRRQICHGGAPYQRQRRPSRST